MAVREDRASYGGGRSMNKFQSAPVFSPQGYSAQGGAPQLGPQGFAPQSFFQGMQSAPANLPRQSGRQYQSQAQDAWMQSGRRLDAPQMSSWQPQQPLPGPWIANEPKPEATKPVKYT